MAKDAIYKYLRKPTEREINYRRIEILKELIEAFKKDKRVSITQLSAMFSVSDNTVTSDIGYLKSLLPEQINRKYNEVWYKETVFNLSLPFAVKLEQNKALKEELLLQ